MDGRFELVFAKSAGPWLVRASMVGHASTEIIVETSGTSDDVVLVIPALPTISGILITRSGDPAPGVLLGVDPPVEGSHAAGKTGGDGEFTLTAPPGVDTSRGVSIVVLDPGPYGLLTDGPLQVSWGASHLLLTIGYPCSVVVEVVEDAGGAPVTEFDAFYASVDQGERQGRPMSQPLGSRGHSSVRFERALPGRGMVIVFPKERRLAPSGPVMLELEEGQEGRVLVRLSAATVIDVIAIWEDGAPADGQRISIVDPGDVTSDRLTLSGILDVRKPLFWTGAEGVSYYVPPMTTAALVDDGVTNEEGRVRLRALTRTHRVCILAEGEGHPPVRKICEPSRAVQETRIVLTRGAAVHGSVTPREAIALDPVVLVKCNGVALRGEAALGGWPVDEQGRFAISGIADGQCDLVVAVRGLKEHVICEDSARSVRVNKERVDDLVLDVGACLPGRLRGRAVIDGKAWHGMVRLHSVQDNRVSRGYLRIAETGSDGAFEMERIPGGRYRLVACKGSGLAPNVLVFPEECRVLPEQTTDLTFQAESTDVRVRVSGPNGPLAKTYCQVWVGDRAEDSLVRHLMTDEQAVLDLEFLNSGPLQVEAVSADRRLFGSLPAGRPGDLVEIQLRARE